MISLKERQAKSKEIFSRSVMTAILEAAQQRVTYIQQLATPTATPTLLSLPSSHLPLSHPAMPTSQFVNECLAQQKLPPFVPNNEDNAPKDNDADMLEKLAPSYKALTKPCNHRVVRNLPNILLVTM